MNHTPEKINGVSLILPTLDEAGNIADLITEAVAAVKWMGVPTVEVLVVDDDSPDHTWEIASNVHCPDATVRVLRRMSDHGLTASLREAIAASTQEVVVWMDCDFSHPPEKIPQLLFMLEQGYDIVVNSRYMIGGGENRGGEGGLLQMVLSRILNWTVRFLLRPSFSDYTSGFVAVRRLVLEGLPLQGDYGEYFVDFIFRALRKHYRVCEVPYWAAPRRSGESKTGSNLGPGKTLYRYRVSSKERDRADLKIEPEQEFLTGDRGGIIQDALPPMSITVYSSYHLLDSDKGVINDH